MCGIAGYVSRTISAGGLNVLLDSMYSRGPDGDGYYHDESVHMGMRRLSVIDLEGGWQPLTSRGGQVVVFQNGEIYNHHSLRKTLQGEGFQFKTCSDTEVIAHGYVQWGLDGLLSKIDGMYAIAIYDRDARQLHLIRDRFGEKPLFYAASMDGFGYASTLLAASSLPWVLDRLDEVGLDRYLATHFIAGDRTIFADVKQVLPGERISLSIDTLSLSRTRYYRPALRQSKECSDNELHSALRGAVESRLEADVPVGVFLSGGIDSSLIAAVAAQVNPNIATFSIGFRDEGADETAYSSAVAHHIGSHHHSFLFDQERFDSLIAEVANVLDTPIGDQALLPLYWLSREARRFVTVVLSGEGADELFGGYSYYPFGSLIAWRHTIRQVRSRILGSIRGRVDAGWFLADDSVTPSGFPLLTSRHERRQLVPVSNCDDLWEQEASEWIASARDCLQAATTADLLSWLPDDLLVKSDRMTMAHSIEARAPFLEPNLAEIGMNLPRHQRRARGQSKVALRRVASAYLPDVVLRRPKKGFVLPMRRWLVDWFSSRGGVRNYFESRSFRGVEIKQVVSIVERDVAMGIVRERLVFALIMLFEWWEVFSVKRAALAVSIEKA